MGDYPEAMSQATVGSVSTDIERRAALKAWLRRRLIEGERPREEWRQLLEATWDHVLATPLRELIHEDSAKALADALIDGAWLTELARPTVVNVARAVIAELREDQAPIDHFLPAEAQERLDAVLARPGLVHPDWVRAMFRGEAAEAVLNDALYRALKDFSTLLPRLMVKVSPVGRFGMLGSAGMFAEKLIEELEKRIEPEIRSFLAESSDRILQRAGEFTISKIDDPASIEFRTNFVRFVLAKSPAFFLEATDDELVADIGTIVELSARHVAEMPELLAEVHHWIDRGFGHAAGKTLAEALEIESMEIHPPIGAIADATWPAFIVVLGSPQAQAWTDRLVDELFDEYERI
jgi:hypothetical protein